ncbi:MAG: hypothetical protein HY231_21435 [Acidobacteria bacterium]|nr:hypothetical protein [Acidobacteriota bacterium]
MIIENQRLTGLLAALMMVCAVTGFAVSGQPADEAAKLGGRAFERRSRKGGSVVCGEL